MTAADAARSLPAAANQAVFPDRFDEVRAARGGESAALAQKRAERPLIDPYQADGQHRRQRNDEPHRADKVPHHFRPSPAPRRRAGRASGRASGGESSRVPRRSHRRRTSWLSFKSESRTAASEGGSSARGITTRSSPGGKRCGDVRNASRINRFHRFRTTALPTLRETDSPSRGWPTSFGRP